MQQLCEKRGRGPMVERLTASPVMYASRARTSLIQRGFFREISLFSLLNLIIHHAQNYYHTGSSVVLDTDPTMGVDNYTWAIILHKQYKLSTPEVQPLPPRDDIYHDKAA